MIDSVLLTLLRRLSDGEFHSGEDLGEILAISRTAVWKQLQKLRDLGVPCETVRGRGYRLAAPLELLDTECIAQAANIDPGRIQLALVTDSTNTQLLSQAAHLPSGSFCLAEQQTAGKGRRGREWISPFGCNLYCSGLWQLEGGAARLEGLSLAVGVCIARVLESVGLEGIQLKWPNDVLVEGKKLAGILLEMSGDPAGDCRVVVGVGVNLHMPAGAGEKIDQPWVDLRQLTDAQGCAPVSRNRLAGLLIGELNKLMPSYEHQGFAPWRSSWLRRAAYLGGQVCLQTANRETCGQFVGVSESGALRLQVEGDEQLFYGGELSLRAKS